MGKKVAYISNTDFSLCNFRMGLMKEMQKRGFEVIACAAETDPHFKERMQEEGIRFIPLPLRKRGVDLLGGDLSYMKRVFFLIRREKPDLCHNFTIKPCIYATLAQRVAGMREIYCTITGRGSAFRERGVVRSITTLLYRLSLRFAKRVVFQNEDDRNLFLDLKIIPQDRAAVIKSSGVDTDRFSPGERKKKDTVTVVFVGRMLYEKGVEELAKAARNIKKDLPTTEFLLVGPIDKENPSSIERERIKGWEKEGILEYLGERRDIKEILSRADIFTLPSYYNEGVPKSLLEAGAMGLPLITTDHPGCRETVENGKNGFLVEPKNERDLEDKLRTLIEEEELRRTQGNASREKMKREFKEEQIIKKTLQIYGIDRS